MKAIVVATDFSAEAENATAYAAAAANWTGVKIILFSLQNISVHVLNTRLPGSTFDQMLVQCNHRLIEAAMAISLEHEVEVIPHLATGDFFEELERCTVQYNAELVVMGMASKSLEQDMLGNHTTSAISRLRIPVLTVPLNAVFLGIKTILFACDHLEAEHAELLQQIKILAGLFKAKVEVFHVSRQMELLSEQEKEQKNMEVLDRELNGVVYYYKNIASERIIEAIKDEMHDIHADLLIMVPYQYGFWHSMVHRSKTRLMASGSDVPLLSLPL